MQSVKITSDKQYNILLQTLCTSILERLPSEEGASISLEQLRGMATERGSVVVNLMTQSSGHDKYLVYITGEGYVNWRVLH